MDELESNSHDQADDESIWSQTSINKDAAGIKYENKSGSTLHGWEDGHATGEKLTDDRSTTLTAGSKGGGVTHAASSSVQAGDVKTTKSGDWAAGYADGKASATVGQKNEIVVGKDHVSTENRASLDGGKVSATHSTSSRVTDPDLGGKVVESKDRTTGLSYDHGTVGVNTANKEQTEVDGHTFAKERAMGVASDKSFDISSKTSHAHKDEHGSESQSSDWGASYKDGKAGGTLGKKTETKIGDDQYTSNESRATLDGSKFSAEQKTSSRLKDPDLGGKVTESKDKTQGVTVDKGTIAVRSATKEQTEVDGHTFAKERAMGVASDKSFNISSKTSHTEKDEHGSHSESSDWAAGYKAGKASATIGKKTETKVGEDQHDTRETRATLDGSKFTAERTTSSQTKDPDLGGKVTESKDKKTGLTIADGKGELARTSKEQTVVDGQTFAKERGTSIGTDGSLKTSSKTSRTYTDDRGEHTDSKGTSFTAGRDGASVVREIEKKTKDGGSSKSSINAAIDAKKGTGTLGGSYGVTTKGGTQAKVGGGLTVDSHGNLVGANASASMTTAGGWTPSISGEYKVEASEPRKEGDKYVVDWTRSAKGGIGLAKKGGKLGIGGTAEMSKRDFGTRMFKTKDEADNFRKNAASMIGGAFGSQTTVEGALAMGVGESRGVGDTSKLGGELTAHFGVAEFGGGGEKSKEDALLVERLSPTIFQITVAAKSDGEAHAGMAVSGFGANEYVGGGETHSTTVQFNLATADGKAAFEEYQRTKVLPKKGAELVSATDAHNARHGTRMSFGPLGSSQFGAEQWESITNGKDGKREVFGGENSQSFVSNIPFFKGHDSSSLNVVATMVNNKDRFYTMQGNVDSTDGDYSQKFLAKITGTHTDGGEHTSSGKWRVDVNIDDAIVDKFLGKIADQRVRDVGIAEKLAKPDFKNELRKLIQAAKTPEDKMRALSYFISESGLESHEGIDAMRAEVFGLTGDQWNIHSQVAGTFHSDLFLEKDPNHVFNGIEGRLAVEQKIGDYTDLLKASDKGGAALVGSMQGDIAELERKRNIVMDVKNYTDLPPELRQMQIDTFQRQIDSLRQLRNVAAKDGVKDLGPEPGVKDTTDPKTKQLRALRKKVAEIDDKITQHKQHIAAMLPDIKRIPAGASAHPQELHAAYEGIKDGDEMQKKALAAEPEADDLRAEFVTALDNPEAAIGAGNDCMARLGLIEGALASAENGYKQMQDFKLGLD